jgi:2'-5' RNA ligase
VAVSLDEPTRTAVAAEIDRLRAVERSAGRAVAWVPAQNLHLTLKFLGEQSDARLGEVVDALPLAARLCRPFAIALKGVGAFPTLDRPRILWVGLTEGGAEARSLQERVEAALEERGLARDTRPWHPHLTIGRIPDDRRWRRDAGPALREVLAGLATQSFGRLRVDRLALMRSDLGPGGARYRELASAPLGG